MSNVMPPFWPYGDLAATVLAALGLAGLVAFAAWLHRRGVSGAFTRALVHAGTGTAVAFAPLVFTTPRGPLVLAFVWACVNLWAIRAGRFPGLHAAGRGGYGTVAFPLALVLGVAVMRGLGTLEGRPHLGWGDANSASLWAAAWLVLALADPAAAFAGRFFGGGQAKTRAGSGAFAGVAFAVAAGVLVTSRAWTLSEALYGAALLTAATTTAEYLGRRGWDNLWIVPAGLAALVAARHYVPVLTQAGLDTTPASAPDPMAALALLVGASFGGIAWRAGLLTSGGALAAALLGATVVAFGGVFHLLTGAGFFGLASLLSKLPGGQIAATLAQKGSTRDAAQVLANGGVAWACLLIFPDAPVLWAGAFAAAAADTWATEIGTRWGGMPRLFPTLRRVPAGTSGAVSGVGTFGAILGAASVAALGLLGSLADGAVSGAAEITLSLRPVLAVFAGGVAGAFFDTLLGATLQTRYHTPDGRRTERPAAPDGTPHVLAGGLAWVNNDAVNALATVAGALVAYGVATL